MNLFQNTLRPAVSVFVLLMAITGIAYPLAVTGIAQVAFPASAHGSLIVVEGRAVGSSLIGQAFSAPTYFWSRPSATGPMPNNAGASSGSNLGANNPVLIDAVASRIAALRAADPSNPAPVPIDLVTASGSGLDPEISLAAAAYQAPRVARSRGMDPAQVQGLIERFAQRPWLGVVGEPRVNVLLLNLALDAVPLAR